MINRRYTSDKLVIFGSLIALVVLLAVCFFLTNLVMNFVSAFIPLATGAMLLIGNRRELIDLVRTRQPSTTVLNAMIGLALVCFGLGVAFFGGSALRVLFYGPGMALLLLALPAAIGRPSIYNSYRSWGTSVVDALKRMRRGGGSSTSPHQPAAAPQTFNTTSDQETVKLDPTQVDPANDPQRRY